MEIFIKETENIYNQLKNHGKEIFVDFLPIILIYRKCIKKNLDVKLKEATYFSFFGNAEGPWIEYENINLETINYLIKFFPFVNRVEVKNKFISPEDVEKIIWNNLSEKERSCYLEILLNDDEEIMEFHDIDVSIKEKLLKIVNDYAKKFHKDLFNQVYLQAVFDFYNEMKKDGHQVELEPLYIISLKENYAIEHYRVCINDIILDPRMMIIHKILGEGMLEFEKHFAISKIIPFGVEVIKDKMEIS